MKCQCTLYILTPSFDIIKSINQKMRAKVKRDLVPLYLYKSVLI